MDSGESSLNRIRVVSTLIRARIRTVSALDVNQILCRCLRCVIPYHASDHSAPACTLKNLRSPSSLQSYRDLVAIYLPFPCWLTNLPAAPHGQAPDSVMGLTTWDQNWGLERGGTNLGSREVKDFVSFGLSICYSTSSVIYHKIIWTITFIFNLKIKVRSGKKKHYFL